MFCFVRHTSNYIHTDSSIRQGNTVLQYAGCNVNTNRTEKREIHTDHEGINQSISQSKNKSLNHCCTVFAQTLEQIYIIYTWKLYPH